MTTNPEYEARAQRADERFVRELAAMRDEWKTVPADKFNAVEAELAALEKRRQAA